ncbi:Fanconi anemia core complex-associated protein 100 [Chanos chanos]|uniref:Fanconi anemia core complex-associated protein 100 n=1 Tax=Chanos chanos TaxID=29144 RepID=A0A6J2VEW2_CHACN|nr:Fanconi anemia core complex-associated protein 100 [Chanos chanos]
MEAFRCSVETLTEFANSNTTSAKISSTKTEVLLTSGSESLLVFSTKERRVTAILKFESPVTALAARGDDKHRLFALCRNDGVYCNTLPTETSSPSLLIDHAPLPTLSAVSSKSIVVKDENICSFLLVEDVLITVSLRDSVWNFSLYKEQGFSTVVEVFQKIGEFHIPAMASKSLMDCVEEESPPPVLSCVCPSKKSSFITDGPQEQFFLEPQLFTLLFGLESSILHSPVVLCGLPDGRLCYFPLCLSWSAEPIGEAKPPVKVLHSLEQPVVFIGTSVTGEKGPQCLVAIGQMGRLLVVGGKENREAGSSFVELSVQGPVVCACVDDSHLYYSTLSDLLVLRLSAAVTTETQLQGSKSDQLTLGNHSPVGLRISGTVAAVNTAESGKLLILTLRGRLQWVKVPQCFYKRNVSTPPSSQAAQRTKDLLAGIGNVWERAITLRQKLLSKNEALGRLNQVINICALLSTNQSNEKVQQQPIRCHTTTHWNTSTEGDSLILTCTIENNSPFTLEGGLILFVQICGTPCASSTNNTSSTLTHSLPLQKLDSGQSFQVALPLRTGCNLSIPLSIQFSLVWPTLALLGLDTGLLSVSDISVCRFESDTACVSLDLTSVTVDWLDVLRIGESLRHRNISPQNLPVDAFLCSRGTLILDEGRTSETRPFEATVHVSSELLRSRLGRGGPGDLALCVCLLDWLLSATPGADRIRPLQSPVVHGHLPSGPSVRLLAKEMVLTDVCNEGPLSVLELQVESDSVVAVCGLHHAILCRLQALLKEMAIKCQVSRQLGGPSLRAAVQQAESLYTQMQESQGPEALGSELKTDALFHLHQRFSQNSLAIL